MLFGAVKILLLYVVWKNRCWSKWSFFTKKDLWHITDRSGPKVAHFRPAKVVYYVRRFQFLSKEELRTLEDKEIDGERLNVVRDMFVFCCYTGLSYIDVQKLHPDNIVKHIDGSLWIKSQRTKTKSRLGIPLFPTSLGIIEKYQDHPKVVNGDCVLPVLNNQKSNA